MTGKKIWVAMPDLDCRVLDTHAAGREIHVHPAGIERYYPAVVPTAWFRRDPLKACLNPRRVLLSEDPNSVRELFPGAVGARVLISGFIVILFQTRRTLSTPGGRMGS